MTPIETAWSYENAFARHAGIMTEAEQQRLRRSRVAIIGMGGVGGVHLMTLARLGIGAFTIADPDSFEIANFILQYGATIHSLGRPKVEVMAEQARSVNPELDIRAFADPISKENVADFLEGADVIVDGVDFFALQARRLVFQEARRRRIWGVTAGPLAFGTGWMTFSPDGMSFDEFFDVNDTMTEADQIIAFAVGGAPTPLHLAYLDLAKFFKPESKAAGSVGLACNLAAGVTAAEIVKILLARPGLRPVPWYSQFDAYRVMLVHRRLRGGNRHPWQRLKRWWLKRLSRKAAARSPSDTKVDAPELIPDRG